MANAPIDKLTVGNVTLSVFENMVGKGKDAFTTKSISIQKNYKDKDGKWNSTTSFKPSELMYVILACTKILEKIYLRGEIDEVSLED